MPASVASGLHEGNVSRVLRRLLQTLREEAEEDGAKFQFNDPFEVTVLFSLIIYFPVFKNSLVSSVSW